jgi:hypothetical protein
MKKISVVNAVLCFFIFLFIIGVSFYVYTDHKISTKTNDYIKKELWATAQNYISNDMISWFVPEEQKRLIEFSYLIILGDILWDNEKFEEAKIIYAKAIKFYYDTDEKLNLLINSSIALDKMMSDISRKSQLNNFSNIVFEEEIEKIEMPDCIKAEDYLDCSVMNATEDKNFIRLTIKVKNLSDDIIMKSSEISIIVFGDKKEYVNGSLIMIPRLEPGEEKYLFSQIENFPHLKNETLKLYYKVNYVVVEE